ncbi:MAG: tRNA (adenosine(37)-N6)-threonylcarbamoyltransferase complex dimerization subunit type 1 TsaB [Pseudomonadota bacterium]
MSENLKFLAFDTSTDQMSIALTDGVRIWQHSGPGGAQASGTLIPAIMALLAESGLVLGDLRAIVFGRGPGSFTGLRTACAVAQGLAFGADAGRGVEVLPVDTLMAVAEEARFQLHGEAVDCLRVTAMLDARMDEMYVQAYEFSGGMCRQVKRCELIRPENMVLDNDGELLAGNVFEVYAGRLPTALSRFEQVHALPTATALLRLAPQLAAAGQCVAASQALPLYVRDKVAFTTEERALAKAEKERAAQSLIDQA